MSVEQDTTETFLEEEDIGVVESRIIFAREDYSMLTKKIEYYTEERSKLEQAVDEQALDVSGAHLLK